VKLNVLCLNIILKLVKNFTIEGKVVKKFIAKKYLRKEIMRAELLFFNKLAKKI